MLMKPNATLLRVLSGLMLVFVSMPAVPQGPAVVVSQSAEIVKFLNQTINWYRQLTQNPEVEKTSTDMIFVQDSLEISGQAVRLAFDFARAEEQLLEKQNPSIATAGQGPNASRYEALLQTSAKLNGQAQQTQQELDALRQQLVSATSRQRQKITSAIGETQSELDMINARRQVIASMIDFLGGTEALGSGDLDSQIDALEHAVPAGLTKPAGAAAGNGPGGENSSSAAIVGTAKPAPSGIWELIANLLALSRKLHTLDESSRLTEALSSSCKQLQTPLVNELKDLTQRADTLASQTDSDPRSIAQQKKDLDALTARFKALSAAVVPLGKQVILLDLYKRNLANWRSAVKGQYSSDLKALLLRLGSLLFVLAIILGVGEVWRRAILRYVHDVRRRYQFLLLRRIALWVVIALAVAFSFASELGSVATFAGLLTAGVAVALQNVLLSIAGYFFLIGKFGVKVGDRVQISGIRGEVIEIGLVRLHLMEFDGNTGDLRPTGRIVAFSNSFVFQPNAGVFRQIPGTNFVWHEITLTLDRNSDYGLVEKRLSAALESALHDYRDDFDRQRTQMERSLISVSVDDLKPRLRLRLTGAGLEATVYFPVELGKASEIDDRVSRELLAAIEREPSLKITGSDIPAVRLAGTPPAPTAKAS
jgi:small-conductance mechanosensitive channel